MDEMRGYTSVPQRGLLNVTHNRITGNVVGLHPLREFHFGWKTGSHILAKML
jgi:hypothetical protein